MAGNVLAPISILCSPGTPRMSTSNSHPQRCGCNHCMRWNACRLGFGTIFDGLDWGLSDRHVLWNGCHGDGLCGIYGCNTVVRYEHSRLHLSSPYRKGVWKYCMWSSSDTGEIGFLHVCANWHIWYGYVWFWFW